MGYASRSGHAITNPQAPRAFGVCDGCGRWWNLYKLRYQYEWQGTKLINTGMRKCSDCTDRPNPQLKARLLPPDPVPVRDPRPENFIASRFDPSPVSGNPITTEYGQPYPNAPRNLMVDGRPIITEQSPQGPLTIE
jgi:hypothetical protein